MADEGALSPCCLSNPSTHPLLNRPLSPFFLEEATSSSSRPPMPPFCFLSPNGEEKKRAGEKKGKKGGDELVGEGRIVSGAVVFTFSLSLSRAF